MRVDLLVWPNKELLQAESWQFPRARLTEVAKRPEVAQAAAVYLGGGKWQEGEGGVRPDISVIGFDPKTQPLAAPDVDRQVAVLDKPYTVLVDSQTRSLFGPLQEGRVVDIA